VTAHVQDALDVVVADWRPTREQSRAAIVKAVHKAAGDHRGLVHAAAVREHLPQWCNPHQVGAVICALVRQGYLVPTGRRRPNGGGKSRNRTKASEVRRLVRPIPTDWEKTP
jgi:hypothetical protein